MSKVGIVDNTVRSYYVNCLEQLRHWSGSQIEKDLFVNQIFSSLACDSFEVMRNLCLSRVVEHFIDFASNAKCFVHLLTKMSKNWETVVREKCAHHLLEKAIYSCQDLFDNKSLTSKDEEATALEDFNTLRSLLTGFCVYMQHNYSDCINDPHASFILRAYLQLISGVKIKSKSYEASLYTPFLDDYAIILADMANRFLLSTHLAGLLTDMIVNPTLQVIVICLSHRLPTKMKEVARFIFKKSDAFSKQGEFKEIDDGISVTLPAIMEDQLGSYFLQALISCSPVKPLRHFIKTQVTSKEFVMSQHPHACFVLSSVIERCKSEESFIDIITVLKSHFEYLLSQHQHVVLLALCKKSLSTGWQETNVASALAVSCHCSKPTERHKDIFFVMGNVCTWEQWQAGGRVTSMTVPGSLLLQQLIQFKDKGMFYTSMCSLDRGTLQALCCDIRGNFVIEAFLKSALCGDKVMQKLVKVLDDSLVDLACDKHGSRVMDTFYWYGSTSCRQLITIQLMSSKCSSRLAGDKFGRFSYYNYAPQLLQSNESKWLSMQSKRPARNTDIECTNEATKCKRFKSACN